MFKSTTAIVSPVRGGLQPLSLQTSKGPSRRRFARAAVIEHSPRIYFVFWVLGVAGIFWPFVTVAVLLSRTPEARSELAHRHFVFVAAMLSVSLPVGILYFGLDLARLIGALANISVWIFLATAARSTFSSFLLSRRVLELVALQGIVTFLAMRSFPRDFVLPIFSDSMNWAPVGVRLLATDRIVYWDWYGEVALRSSGIMGNPTWAGAFAAAGVLMGIDRLWRLRVDRVLALLAIALGLYSIGFSLSRSTMVALTVGIVLYFVVQCFRRGSVGRFASGLAVFAVLLVVLGIYGNQVSSSIIALNEERSGSLDTRGAIYEATWAGIQQNSTLLLGYGLKPREQYLVASVASHSTYLGLVYRGGPLALLALLSCFFALAVRGLRSSSSLGLSLLALVSIWSLVEDLDVGHLLPIVLALAIRLIQDCEDVFSRAEEGVD